MSANGRCSEENAVLPISFFKVILPTNLERIKIPTDFTMRYGDGLPNPVVLNPPDGTKWQVCWTEHNGGVWLINGWKEFAEYYSLDHGYLVVFKYEGTSLFDVLILDKSALEIDYPSFHSNSTTCDGKLDYQSSDDDDDESVIILDESPRQKKPPTQNSPASSSPPSPEKMRGEERVRRQRTASLNFPKQRIAREVANNFISYNPFFTIFIKPAHLTAGYRMTVPNWEDYMENEVEDMITLQIGKGSWKVRLVSYYNPVYHRLSVGWSKFASENELQPGDVCIFELISKKDSVFKVYVTKNHP